MADVEGLISSTQIFYRMYYVESKAITKTKKLTNTASSDKSSHFIRCRQQQPGKFMSSCWFPCFLALGLQKRKMPKEKPLVCFQQGSQRHRVGPGEGRLADEWLQSCHLNQSHSGHYFLNPEDIQRKIPSHPIDIHVYINTTKLGKFLLFLE